MTLVEKSEKIKNFCRNLGFDGCGIVPAHELTDQRQRLLDWLEKGYHGQMTYMERNIDKRLNPALLLPDTKSIIVTITNYYPAKKLNLKHYKISKYAQGIDYHFVIKKRLWQLLKLINEHIQPCNGRPFTDSAPILEQALAVRAGLGWIGKNSLLITKKGSYFFIAELLVNIELAYDTPFTKNFCGKCTACIDACPTKAIVEPGTVDARKCISYLTIEKRGPLPPQTDLHGWIFGCDICQDACPWNRKPIPTTVKEFIPSELLLNLTDKQLENLTPQQFKRIFNNTPVERTKYQGLMRNIKAQKFYPLKDDAQDA